MTDRLVLINKHTAPLSLRYRQQQAAKIKHGQARHLYDAYYDQAQASDSYSKEEKNFTFSRATRGDPGNKRQTDAF